MRRRRGSLIRPDYSNSRRGAAGGPHLDRIHFPIPSFTTTSLLNRRHRHRHPIPLVSLIYRIDEIAFETFPYLAHAGQPASTVAMADQVESFVEVPKEFVKDGVQFINKCQKRESGPRDASILSFRLSIPLACVYPDASLDS
jgi:hypothetical protein